MRLLNAKETIGIRRAWPLSWKSDVGTPAFIFDVPQNETGFVCFFLIGSKGQLTPAFCIDDGQGFNELETVSLKAFPVAFYHVPVDSLKQIRRISFRPATSEPAVFRFTAFWTKSSPLVAILHYLFNLRYQAIGLLADDGRQLSFWEKLKMNAVRISKFFGDVSKGQGARVQASAESTLPMLVVHMSMEAQTLQSRLNESALDNDTPLISFVCPTYNTEVTYLNDLVQSFIGQKAHYAELILSDDGSTNKATLAELSKLASEAAVKVMFSSQNQGIAATSNRALAEAKGKWVSFIDHDDQFVAGVIPVIVDAIQQHPDAEFFYTDELVADENLTLVGAFCKPAYDSVLLSGLNYINHFSVFKRSRLEAIGWIRTDREGSQDYDLLLRYLRGLPPQTIFHIPFPGYRWRRNEHTYSHVNIDRAVGSARHALKAAYEAEGKSVEILPSLDPRQHRISFRSESAKPRVSVIIPNKDRLDLIQRVVTDLRARTIYPSLEIVIVDNGSRDPGVLKYYDQLRQEMSSVIIDVSESPFNFSAMCNRGAELASGDVLLLLNNDIEVREPQWLEEMVECLSFEDVGIVGAKLLYPDGSIQHNGVIVGLGQAAAHWYIGEAADAPGPMGRFYVRQTMTAVTGACMLITRACFETLGGFDAVNFPISYNDVDFCLRAKAAGFRTVWTPFAELIHHESATRGSDETGPNNLRFKIEFARLQEKYGTIDYIDDAGSPFYDSRFSVPHFTVPRELPRPRGNVFS